MDDTIIEIPHTVKYNEKLKRDPHLNKNDIKKLDNTGIGGGFNVNFKNGEKVINCTFTENQKSKSEIANNNTNEFNYEKQTISPKQERIIMYLINNQSKNEMTKTFFELLKKLDLPDYRMLSTHIISEERILLQEKQKMLKVIQLFKNTLGKKKQTGETVYNGMQIDDIIKLL